MVVVLCKVGFVWWCVYIYVYVVGVVVMVFVMFVVLFRMWVNVVLCRL